MWSGSESTAGVSLPEMRWRKVRAAQGSFQEMPSLCSDPRRWDLHVSSNSGSGGVPTVPRGGNDLLSAGTLTLDLAFTDSRDTLVMGSVPQPERNAGMVGRGRQGREGSSGGIIMEPALAINFNQFKTYFLGIKLH